MINVCHSSFISTIRTCHFAFSYVQCVSFHHIYYVQDFRKGFAALGTSLLENLPRVACPCCKVRQYFDIPRRSKDFKSSDLFRAMDHLIRGYKPNMAVLQKTSQKMHRSITGSLPGLSWLGTRRFVKSATAAAKYWDPSTGWVAVITSPVASCQPPPTLTIRTVSVQKILAELQMSTHR